MSVSSVPSGATSGRKWRGKRAGQLRPAAAVIVESAPADERAGLAPISADILPSAGTYFQESAGAPPPPPNFDDELEPASAGRALRQVAGRRITGLYSADEVRALPGDLVSIESTLEPGRFLCAWLEWSADDKRRLDGG